ncbi:MAG TPA: nuclear transport factor 2 family protein [Microbacterium sp.]|nr:nuclear transport factor 2 family protein [Microbacterium sp.]
MSYPTEVPAQLQWLTDRAAITDLILDFARCVDDRDHERYVSNFLEDGQLVLPFHTAHGRDAILTMPTPPESWKTHHHLGNIYIQIDGDVATSRAYLTATHVFSDDRTDNAHAGGWYEHEVVRTPEGWRFRRVELVVVWEEAKPMMPADVGTSVARQTRWQG